MQPDISPEGLEAEEDLRRGELSRGHRARQIFEDELVQEALTKIRDGVWKDFAATELTDDATRTRLRLKLDILKEFGEDFLRAMETGRLAEEQLTWLERQTARLKKTRVA